LLNAHLAGRADHGNRLWLLINAELWYRMMILGESREDLRSELSGTSPVPAAATQIPERVGAPGVAAARHLA
jgi:hypothetical protein